MQCRVTQLSNKSGLLIVFDQLVEAEQDAEAYCPVVGLQIEANLVHDGRPLPRVVVLDHVVDAGCQLYSDQVKSADKKRVDLEKSHLDSGQHMSAVLPDALGGVDDGLHDVVSDKLPVLVRNVIDRRLGA